MAKSSRHSKITGDFGEAAILYWLSKRGFECARVDHTGIDLIARRPASDEVLGISVKARSRDEARSEDAIMLTEDDLSKAEVACRTFKCVPYLAIIVDQGSHLRAFLMTVDYFRRIAPSARFRVAANHLDQHFDDADMECFELANGAGAWRMIPSL